ncbi:photosystem II reaction center PsbP [Oscillatoria sp. FACHB-1406]|uniref:photosystem II reaction center PsbP n=1 Tax=Oscillatoria sp. FACHB-1406 TaxID=2692846 RepID=UPI001681E263|nr:photosystem II reaction center PsbP [Oscillatoria sp. FACHB-1406]MBD2578739.1 photosystem II reaction center PsbP family protein [Oscillatoria sp. FACHB-1406]
MKEIEKRVRAWLLSLVLVTCLGLTGCVTGVSGLQKYADNIKGYQFLYPNGWVPVEVQGASEGVDVVFRDIIERSENLSLIVSDIPEGKTLESLGTPTEVGYRFLKQTNSTAPQGRTTEFLRAGSYEVDAKPYYILEYAVELPDAQQRHNIATVAVNRGKLYTFNLSAAEERWENVKEQFEASAKSFSVY